MSSSASNKELRLRNLFVTGTSRYTGAKFGLEIEAERVSAESNIHVRLAADARRAEYWNVVPDGSLRNGMELVSSPLSPGVIEEALEGAYSYLNARGYSSTVRCGLHVHANMAGRTRAGFQEMLATYILAEPFLFGVVGKEREQSIYCVPWYVDYNQYRVATALSAGIWAQEPIRQETIPEMEGACKYSALNLLPLFKFHTIEFRHAPSYPTAHQTLAWTQLIVELTEKASWVCSRTDPVEAVKGMFVDKMSSEAFRQAEETFDEHSLYFRYKSFMQDGGLCTYKPQDWGLPAALEAAQASVALVRRPSPLASRRPATRMPPPPRLRTPARDTARAAPTIEEARRQFEADRQVWLNDILNTPPPMEYMAPGDAITFTTEETR